MIRLSIIIPCVNGLPCIDECLTALSGQERSGEAEIIVVNAARDGSADRIRQCHPHVVLIDLETRPGIPEMRWIGAKRAQGSVLAWTEDHCLAPPGWIAGMLREHEAGRRVVGGPVANGCAERLTDRAVFLCEYAGAMPPVAAGPCGGVPGNNASFDRKLLDLVPEADQRASWEYFIHRQWAEAGVTFHMNPDLVMVHQRHFDFAYFVSQRYHYSRSFAAMRNRTMSTARRAACALFTPALPLLMLARIARHAVAKKYPAHDLLAAMPLLALFMLSYAWGEFAGYVFGPGTSLEKVE